MDNGKGSFYANPMTDVTHHEINGKTVAYENVWPSEDLPELEPTFKELGKLMYSVGIKMANHLGI